MAKNEKDNGVKNESQFQIPETFLRSNAEFRIFDTASGPVKIKMLTCEKAELWADEVRAIDLMDDKITALERRYTTLLTHRNMIAETLTSTEEEITEATAIVETAILTIRKAQKERYFFAKTCVITYNPDIFTSELLSECTPGQIVGAVEMLRQYNDPFFVTSALRMEVIAETTRRLRSTMQGAT